MLRVSDQQGRDVMLRKEVRLGPYYFAVLPLFASVLLAVSCTSEQPVMRDKVDMPATEEAAAMEKPQAEEVEKTDDWKPSAPKEPEVGMEKPQAGEVEKTDDWKPERPRPATATPTCATWWPRATSNTASCTSPRRSKNTTPPSSRTTGMQSPTTTAVWLCTNSDDSTRRSQR